MIQLKKRSIKRCVYDKSRKIVFPRKNDVNGREGASFSNLFGVSRVYLLPLITNKMMIIALPHKHTSYCTLDINLTHNVGLALLYR